MARSESFYVESCRISVTGSGMGCMGFQVPLIRSIRLYPVGMVTVQGIFRSSWSFLSHVGGTLPNGGWRNYMELLYRIRTYPTPLLLGADHFLRSSICHHFSISCNSLSKDLTQYKKKHVSGVLSILSDEHGRFMTFPILLHHLQPVHPMSIVHPLTAALEQFCASKVGISPTCGTRFDTVVLS